MHYRREIDGLRALAVLSVMFYHAGVTGFGGGYLGVDVFFVISGYLITSILQSELQAGTFSFAGFYERRVRRILPALVLVVVVSIPFAWFWLLPEDLRSFANSLVAIAVMASNVQFLRESGYFDVAASLKPMLHTWSLAVEEQYYFLFPLLLAALWKFGKRVILGVLAVLALSSLVAAFWAGRAYPDAAFYLLPTRSWELLSGAMLAVAWPNNAGQTSTGRWQEWAGAAGLLTLVLVITTISPGHTANPSFTLLAVTSTLLVIHFARSATLAGRCLGAKWLVGLGLVSYSAYLWHQPVLSFAHHRNLSEPAITVRIGLIAAAFVLAFFSWKFVELPFRDKRRTTKKSILLFAVTGSALIFGVGITGHVMNGFPGRSPDFELSKEMAMPAIDNGWCFYNVDTLTDLQVGENGTQCWLGNKESATKGILMGDSYAGQYEPLWDRAGKEAGAAIHAVTSSMCYPSLDEVMYDAVAGRLYQQCVFNRHYLTNTLGNYQFAVLGANWGFMHQQGVFKDAVALMDAIAPKLKLLILMPVPKQYDEDLLQIYRKSLWHKTPFDIDSLAARHDDTALQANALLAAYAMQHENVVFIHRDSLFSLDGKASELTSEGIPFSLDGGHISIYGSLKAAESLLQSAEFARIKVMLQP